MTTVESLILVGFLVGPILAIVSLVDAAQRPAWAYQQAGFEKVTWVTLAATGIVLSWLGAAAAIAYLVGVRDKVAAAQRSPMLASPPPPGPPAAPTAIRRPAEWLPDPSRRHQLRWWDGTRWTEHVSDQGQQAWDRL